MHLGQINNCSEPQIKAQQLADGIAASIPYHLVDDVNTYVEGIHNDRETRYNGKPVGGLLMLHPLWVVANASAVSEELRTYMRKQLAWIGKFSK